MISIGEYKTPKIVNNFFKTALKSDVDDKYSKLCLSDLQSDIFRLKYMKKKDTNYIADTLGFSRAKIDCELKTIRQMLSKII